MLTFDCFKQKKNEKKMTFFHQNYPHDYLTRKIIYCRDDYHQHHHHHHRETGQDDQKKIGILPLSSSLSLS